MSRPKKPIRHLDPVVRHFLHSLEGTDMDSQDIADRAGIHASDISFWRSGARTPSEERMKMVLVAVGLPDRLPKLRLVSKEPDPVAPVYAPRVGLTRGQHLTAKFFGDPPSGRSALDQRVQG